MSAVLSFSPEGSDLTRRTTDYLNVVLLRYTRMTAVYLPRMRTRTNTAGCLIAPSIPYDIHSRTLGFGDSCKRPAKKCQVIANRTDIPLLSPHPHEKKHCAKDRGPAPTEHLLSGLPHLRPQGIPLPGLKATLVRHACLPHWHLATWHSAVIPRLDGDPLP